MIYSEGPQDGTTKVYLDMYENIVILEKSCVTGVISKVSLTKLVKLLGMDEIAELCDLVKPDFMVSKGG